MSLVWPLADIPAGSVLHRIVSRKVEDVARRAKNVSLDGLERAIVPSDRSFVDALRKPGLSLIAEVKRRSPSSPSFRDAFDLPSIAAIYGRHASAISVLCDAEFFGGSLDDLREVRARVVQPVLLKDFVVSAYQLFEGRCAGADAVLLMASVLAPEAIEPAIATCRALGMEPLVEVRDVGELERVLDGAARIIGINNRDLRTLAIDRDTFPRLAASIGCDRIVVAESGVSSREDLEHLGPRADAVLIGSAFMRAPDVEAMIVELGW